jgi:hypothetical protein
MEGLIEEGSQVIEEDAEPEVKDAALIAAAQRVEHYEIAVYDCVRMYAKLLGHSSAMKLLRQTLDEESDIDKTLTKLVEAINVEAATWSVARVLYRLIDCTFADNLSRHWRNSVWGRSGAGRSRFPNEITCWEPGR